jgi:hypothetical protein
MSQLGEFIATIQNNQDVRTAELEARLAQLEGKEECGCAETITALEERLATLESKEECGCAETITALEERLATLESKEECGCAETITALEERLATLESKEECGCAETITALEERLATLESKEECGCGSYDELLASYEERISALEGNTGGGGDDSGSTEGEEMGAYPVAIVKTGAIAADGKIYALPKEGTAVAYFRPYTSSIVYEASNEFGSKKAAQLLENADYPTYALMSDNSLISISTVEDIGMDPNSDEDILIKYIPCNSVNPSVNLYLINGERYGVRFGAKYASTIDANSSSYDHHFNALQDKIDELIV